MDEKILAMLTELLDGQKQIVARVDRIEGAIPSAKEEKLWFSPEELAERMHRKPYTVREWARRGRIRAKKVEYCNKWTIHRDEVERLLAGGMLLPEMEAQPA